MTITTLLLLWDETTEIHDNSMDFGDYRLANAVVNYLDMLACEIECFYCQL